MFSHETMKKITKPVIWIIAILFIAGVVWWSIASFIFQDQEVKQEEELQKSITETAAYLTKDGTPIDNPTYWVYNSDYESAVRNNIAYYENQGVTPDPYFSSSNVPSEIEIRYNIVSIDLNDKVMLYYASENDLLPDLNAVETEAASTLNSYIEGENGDYVKQQIIYLYGSLDNFKNQIASSITMQKVVENIENNVIKDLEGKVENYYNGNLDQLKSEYEKVIASHILVDNEASATEIKEKIDNGELTFTEAASEFSIDAGTAAIGGSLEPFGKGQMVEPFENAAFTQEIGVLSDPVKTDYGYHLILVEDRTTFDSFDEFKNTDAYTEIKNQLMNEELDAWLKDYKKTEGFGYDLNDVDLVVYDKYNKAVESNDTEEFRLDLQAELFPEATDLVISDSYLPPILYTQLTDTYINGQESTISEYEDIKDIYETVPSTVISLSTEEADEVYDYYTNLNTENTTTDQESIDASITADSTSQTGEIPEIIGEIVKITPDATQIDGIKKMMLKVKRLRGYEEDYGELSPATADGKLEELNDDLDKTKTYFDLVVKRLYQDMPNSAEVVQYMYNIEPDNPQVVYDYYSDSYDSIKAIISNSSTYEYYLQYYQQYLGAQARSYLIDYPIQNMELELNNKIIEPTDTSTDLKVAAIYIMIDAYQNLSNLPVNPEMQQLYLYGEKRYLEELEKLMPGDGNILDEINAVDYLLTDLASQLTVQDDTNDASPAVSDDTTLDVSLDSSETLNTGDATDNN